MDAVRRDVIVVTSSGALVAGVFLFFVFRAAQARINRQTKQLVDATRRDPLTGLANHGALLTVLAAGIEAARQVRGAHRDRPGRHRWLPPAERHLRPRSRGCGARQAARLLVREFDSSTVIGRYGPDEFLVIVDATKAWTLEPAIERLQTVLATEVLDFDPTGHAYRSRSARASVCTRSMANPSPISSQAP